MEEYRVIPGYEGYCVSNAGMIKSIERDLILQRYCLNGYLIVDAFRSSLTETLPVHRAVALAWVPNPDPVTFTVVNHLDGNPFNNWYKNLEWTTYSGNNYHAVNNGLRVDNICCKVRDFVTGNVVEFSSIAQAAEYMGLGKDTPICMLRPKKFGSLVADRFEFRFAEDPEPWFYGNRQERVPPSRYMVNVRESNGDVREVYSTRALLKDYQLYDSPSKAVSALAQYGNQIYPDKQFEVRDSYAEEQLRVTRKTKQSKRQSVIARFGKETLEFDSLTQCAKRFHVDRSSIVNRLDNGKDLDGWTFTQSLSGQ
jgi:hypothetical protein